MKKILFICLLALSVCPVPNYAASDDDDSDPILDLIGGAFKKWGKSKFLSMTGLGGSPLSGDIGQIKDDLNELIGKVDQLQSQVEQLEGEFSHLESKIDNNDLRDQLQKANSIGNSIGSDWSGFSNDVGNNNTFADIANSSEALSKLKEQSNNGLICNLGKQSSQLLDQGKVGYFGSGLSAYSTVLSDQLNDLKQSSTYVDSIEQYNNALQIYLFEYISALQMAYTIQNTYLYLSYNESDFSSLTYCIPGVFATGSSYEESLTALNKYYVDGVNALVLATIPMLISDEWSALTYPRASDVNPQPAKTLSWVASDGSTAKIIGGDWSDNCTVYSWDGVTNSAYSEGAYDNDRLAAQCAGVQTALKYKTYCTDSVSSDGLGAYVGKNSKGDDSAMLQCMNYEVSLVCNSTSSSGHCQGFYTTPISASGNATSVLSPSPWFSTADSHAKLYFYPDDMESFPTGPSYTVLDLADDQDYHDNGFYVETAKMVYPDSATGPQGGFLIPLQFNGSKNDSNTSTHTVFFVESYMKQHGLHYHWYISLACADGDDFCWTIDSHENSLCMGEDQVQLTIKDSGSSETHIQYVSGGCS